ncbi:MAG: hypothetical protein AAGJ97_14770 [Planctomycetota bacterium]
MSYTPGLTVTDRVRWRVRRRMPLGGAVTVGVGDPVTAEQIVALAELPGDVVPLAVADHLGVAASDLPRAMRIAEGEAVSAGATVAETAGPFGWFAKSFAAPCDGTVESVSEVTGRVILRGRPKPVEVRAFLSGVVAEVDPVAGVTVESDAAVVQGVFGVGGEAFGTVRCLAASADEDVGLAAVDRLGEDVRDAVVVGGRRVTAEALSALIDRGTAAVVTGGIDDAELRELLGYEIGVAVTGDERIGLTLVLTEGFGPIAMADGTFDLLRSLEGRAASVDGTTQIRAGVMRPVVVVPHADRDDAAQAGGGVAAGRLAVGADVRIIAAANR